MADLNISYEEREGRRRRHWWNKIIGIVIVGPIAVVIATVPTLGLGHAFFSVMTYFGFEFVDYKERPSTNPLQVYWTLGDFSQWLFLIVGFLSIGAIVISIFSWWMNLMADSNDGVSDS